MMRIRNHYINGVYIIDTVLGPRPATKNMVPGIKVYGEELIMDEQTGTEYRIWDPYKSKLAAAIAVNMTELPQMQGCSILYLGAAQGTTCSHVSDIAGEKGVLTCVEFAQKPVQKLLTVVERRMNMIPVLDDARFPERIAPFVEGKIDVLFQDISQTEQGQIFCENAVFFLKRTGLGILALKARSIDAKSSTEDLEEAIIDIASEKGMKLIESASIHEYEKHHRMMIFTLD